MTTSTAREVHSSSMTTSTAREVSLTFCSTAFLAANNARILDLSACSSFAAPTPQIILTSLYLLVPRHINSLSLAFVRPALKCSREDLDPGGVGAVSRNESMYPAEGPFCAIVFTKHILQWTMCRSFPASCLCFVNHRIL